MGPNERKISADKGMTEFLFGHYNDLIGSEVTHSKVFSEDLAWLWEENLKIIEWRSFFVCPHYEA